MLPAVLLAIALQVAEHGVVQPPVGSASPLGAAPGAVAGPVRFIPVEGADLQARRSAAKALAKSRATPFWTEYGFDVRPGVAVDADTVDHDGNVTVMNGTALSFRGGIETRNLGVFLLQSPGSDAVERVEVYNLDRAREYAGYPVYWLGRAGNRESLALLGELAGAATGERVPEHAVLAIALHDDPSVGSLLEGFVRTAAGRRVRETAVFWLGQLPGERPFLARLVRDDREPIELRKKAAFAIGASGAREALPLLRELYRDVSAVEVRKQIIFVVSLLDDEWSGAGRRGPRERSELISGVQGTPRMNEDERSGAGRTGPRERSESISGVQGIPRMNEDENAAVDFLIDVAAHDASQDARRQAIFWLGQKGGRRTLKVLGDTATSSDADTRIQKQAVFAISQRPRDEAIPLLIDIAKTHKKAEVRKQAIFWLAQTGDPRALAFFRELFAAK